MITQQKRKVDGWTIEKMTFPKGYQPRSVRWRSQPEHDRYQVEVVSKIPENVNKYLFLQEIDDAVVNEDGTVTGWKTMSKSAYDWDRHDAGAEAPANA